MRALGRDAKERRRGVLAARVAATVSGVRLDERRVAARAALSVISCATASKKASSTLAAALMARVASRLLGHLDAVEQRLGVRSSSRRCRRDLHQSTASAQAGHPGAAVDSCTASIKQRAQCVAGPGLGEHERGEELLGEGEDVDLVVIE